MLPGSEDGAPQRSRPLDTTPLGPLQINLCGEASNEQNDNDGNSYKDSRRPREAGAYHTKQHARNTKERHQKQEEYPSRQQNIKIALLNPWPTTKYSN